MGLAMLVDVALVAAYFVGRPVCKDLFHPQAMRRLATSVGWTPIDLVPAIRGRLPCTCLDVMTVS